MKNSSKFSENQALSLFSTFLRRNNAYKSFIRNLSRSSIGSSPVDLNLILPEHYISCVFHWDSTPEGVKYWDALNNKWKLVLILFNF